MWTAPAAGLAPSGMSDHQDLTWYSVRCVFAVGSPPSTADETYEERVTLWRARSAEEALARAEAEARQYGAGLGCTYLGLAQSYRLADDLGDGSEVFSLMRTSALAPDDYLDTFFDAGSEHQS